MTSPEVFFALVDRHVTPPMLHADYTRIGEYDEVTAAARGVPLVAVRSQSLASRRWFRSARLPLLRPRGVKASREHVLRVGYEGFAEDGGDDERWVAYFPDTHELDLHDWRHELEQHADWDVSGDRLVRTPEELERRLRVLGAAMRQSRGGS